MQQKGISKINYQDFAPQLKSERGFQINSKLVQKLELSCRGEKKQEPRNECLLRKITKS